MTKIPIVIGVTGHRNIKKDACEDIKNRIKECIVEIKSNYPNSDIVMLNSLASGGDSICADIAIELGIGIIAILPFDKDEYIKDFNEEESIKFNEYLSKAKDQIVVSGSTRDDAYRNAGLYVANHSHVLIALWDGNKGTSVGCGTADVVFDMTEKHGEYSIIHIVSPREGSDSSMVSTEKIEPYPGCTEKILKTTDRFNKDATSDSLFESADKLSLDNQRKYNRSLLSLAICGVLMVLAFLFYDELDVKFCLPLYGVLLLIGFAICYRGNKSKYHSNYLNFRMFAESLRVQELIDDYYCDVNVADFYTWTCFEETAWIRKAIAVSKLFGRNCSENDLTRKWIDEELAYHINAKDKVNNKQRRQNSISKLFNTVTIAIIVVFCFIEMAIPSIMGIVFLGISLKLWCCILVGVSSAASLFISTYYEKLALRRKAEDHNSMMNLYKDALRKLNSTELPKEIVLEIAKEEIRENGNWFSYMKENKLDVNL